MKLTFLNAPVPLTKSYSKRTNGTIDKRPYPNIYEVTSLEESCSDLKSMEALLKKHAALGHCLLKGNPTRPLYSESRAGTTDTNGTTDWIILDVDGIPGCSSIEDFLKAMKIEDTSYIVQWSASYGIENNDLRAHVFIRLAKPLAAPLIKQWLIGLNHSVSILREAMTLTKTGNAISWPLDISACQNDKLLYIAPPLLKGIKDPMAKKPRIEYVKKINEALTIDSTIASTAQNRELTAKRVNEIRAALGYPTRKTTFKMHGSTEVMVKPDTCIVTDMKIERGFVYFNLNGGDSWGYYHPEDNPDYIFNFKSEPAYVTKELLPDYWQSLTQQAVRTSSQGVTYLAFCDRKTGAYWRGTHDAQTDVIDLYIAKNETQVRHFAKQHGMPLGDFIPEWDVVFDPHDNVRIDIDNRTVNTFQPTIYMQQIAKKVTVCPKMILKVIHHALGKDPDITEHFMNWLAYILQNRTRAQASWVLHGRTGTGKGTLFHKILRPLLGHTQTAFMNMESLAEKYNDYMQNCLLVFVDEVETKTLRNESGVMAKMRSFVTEETIRIRAMHSSAFEVPNYTNWICSSNKPGPVELPKDDRRTNVSKFQPEQLVLDDKDLEQIKNELQPFHDYLIGYAVDQMAVKTPIDTTDRNIMIGLSESSVDTVGSALLEGNFEFFIDQMPTTTSYNRNTLEMNRVADYTEVLQNLIVRTKADGDCKISREELRTLFDYTVGGIPTSPNKFTSLLKHHRIHIAKVWIENSAIAGIKTIWKDVGKFDEYKKIVSPAQPAKKAVK